MDAKQEQEKRKQIEKELKVWVDLEDERARNNANHPGKPLDAAIKTLNTLTAKNSKFQSKYFLNAFWGELGATAEPENIFTVFYPKFVELNRSHWKNSGNDPRDFLDTGSLPEDLAFKFVEDVWDKMWLGGGNNKGERYTALKFRQKLKEIDQNNDGKLSMVEFLMWNYLKSPESLFSMAQLYNYNQIGIANHNVWVVEENQRTWAKERDDLQKTIDSAASKVAQNKAVQNLKNHMDKEDQYNRDLSSAKRQLKQMISQAFKAADAKGSAWWIAREFTQKEQDGPKKTSNLKRPAGIQG